MYLPIPTYYVTTIEVILNTYMDSLGLEILKSFKGLILCLSVAATNTDNGTIKTISQKNMFSL